MASQPASSTQPAASSVPTIAPGSEKMTRSKMLWKFRTQEEYSHRRTIHLAAVTLNYEPSVRDIHVSALPQMTVGDFADTCNKSVPLYIRMQHRDNSRWHLFAMVLHNYIYHRWFRPYRSDIEDNRFICKFITPKDLPREDDSDTPPSRLILDLLVALNGAICAEADTRRARYAEGLAAGDKEVAAALRFNGMPITDLEQHQVIPLFRALLIVVDSKYFKTEYDSTTVGTNLPVFLVRTGVEDGLSEPISFSSIANKIDGYEGEAQTVAKTSLETAIDFVMALEERERAAFGVQPPMTNDAGYYYDEYEWKKQPWGGEPPAVPSSRFVDMEEFPQWSGDGTRIDSHLAMEEEDAREFVKEMMARQYVSWGRTTLNALGWAGLGWLPMCRGRQGRFETRVAGDNRKDQLVRGAISSPEARVRQFWM